MSAVTMSAALMSVLGIRNAQVTYPTGDPNFSVLQSFPAGFTAEEADPFLMCDEFGPTASKGKAVNDDEFPIAFHPHRGQDLLTYLVAGVGRHADSMGNRGSFVAPGIQWMSAGSGIEHAEGGGTPKGEIMHGFQIWVNVPSANKMDDPKYGIDGSDRIPKWSSGDGVSVSVLAGPFDPPNITKKPLGDSSNGTCLQTVNGPFNTIAKVSIYDVILEPNTSFEFALSDDTYDNCLLYFYGDTGTGTVNGQRVDHGKIMRLDASTQEKRSIVMGAGDSGLRAMVFSGKKLNQPIAWHGPFVMTTDAEIRKTLQEYRSGTFLKRRAPFNYKRRNDAPEGWDFENGLSQCL